MIHQSITKDGIFKFYRPNFKILILLAIFTLSQGNEVILSRSSQSCVSSGRTCEDANSHCCDGLNCYKRSKRDFKRCVPCKDEGKPCGHDLHCCSYKCRNKVCTMKSTNTCNCESTGTYDTLDDLNIDNAVDHWHEDKSSAEATYGKIECWNVEKVTSMGGLFGREGNENFNENLECWHTSSVTDMKFMFMKAISFNQKLNAWDVSNVENMFGMFLYAISFNQDLNDWYVSKVKNMRQMFYGTTNFNGDISNWNVNQVTMMESMFGEAESFTDNLTAWDVSNVENMNATFYKAEKFNGDVSNWDVSKVNDMSYMFVEATSFKVNVSNWDVSSVTSMLYMFNGAESFDQSLCWDVSSKEVGQMYDDVEGMFKGSSGCILKDCCPKCEDLLFC